MVIVALCIEGEIIFALLLYDGQTFRKVDVKLESHILQLAGVGSADLITLELNGKFLGLACLDREVRDVELVFSTHICRHSEKGCNHGRLDEQPGFNLFHVHVIHY